MKLLCNCNNLRAELLKNLLRYNGFAKEKPITVNNNLEAPKKLLRCVGITRIIAYAVLIISFILMFVKPFRIFLTGLKDKLQWGSNS